MIKNKCVQTFDWCSFCKQSSTLTGAVESELIQFSNVTFLTLNDQQIPKHHFMSFKVEFIF